MEKYKEGWALVALEWEREVSPEEADRDDLGEEIPYGLRIAEDCVKLVDNPAEKEALKAMLHLIVDDDIPFSRVGEVLNERGFRTRNGTEWTQSAIFEMLPRLIEVAPRIYSSAAWGLEKAKQ
jgi:hypothetical protein